MDEPIRIVFGVQTLGVGGSERRWALLASAAAQHGWHVWLMTLQEAPCAWESVIDPRVQRLCLATGHSRWRALRRTWRALRRIRPDVYSGVGPLSGFIGSVAARLAGVPLVVNALNTTPSYVPRTAAAPARWCFRFAHLGTANSTGSLRYHVDRWGFPERKLVVIPNFVRTAETPCREPVARAAVRSELGLRDDSAAVVAVGRLERYKGHHVLLEAFARLAPDRSSAQLFLAGDGPCREGLESQARSLGIAERTRFLGSRSDVPRLLQGMDLFVLPSLVEGMPNALLEAMAAGLAAVATRVSGSEDLVVPGETGWLVPPGEPEPLAAALAEALADPDRCAAMGAAARRRAEVEFDETVIVPRYLDLYAERLRRH